MGILNQQQIKDTFLKKGWIDYVDYLFSIFIYAWKSYQKHKRNINKSPGIQTQIMNPYVYLYVNIKKSS